MGPMGLMIPFARGPWPSTSQNQHDTLGDWGLELFLLILEVAAPLWGVESPICSNGFLLICGGVGFNPDTPATPSRNMSL